MRKEAVMQVSSEKISGYSKISTTMFVLFDLILYVHSTIFQLCGTGLPGLNRY